MIMQMRLLDDEGTVVPNLEELLAPYKGKYKYREHLVSFEKILPLPTAYPECEYPARHTWGSDWCTDDARFIEDGSCFYFHTTWKIPYPIISELSKIFSQYTLQLYYTRDCLSGWPTVTGTEYWKNGVLTQNNYPETRNDEKWRKFAYRVYYPENAEEKYQESQMEP